MSEQFKYLFSPLKIGNVSVQNRIFNPAHGTMFSENQLPGERLAYYHAERAKGGVGLIITEITAVHPTARPMGDVLAGWDKRLAVGYRRVADMVHEHGTKIFGQLWHCGRQGDSMHSRLPLWSASPIPSPANREIPHEMSVKEIKEIVNCFATTATYFREAGFDGVELHGAHGYIITQFMSPWSNERTDEYGGSLENRLRFPLEIIDAVRQAVGSDFVVGIRVSGDEFVSGGLTLDDMKGIAPKLEATGKLNYISVSIGNYSSHYLMIADMAVPLGAAVYLAAGIKEVVQLPVFTVLRIKDPVQAEKILADGQADMVGMCRALICDPELPKKAKEGRLDDIRYCISCNQECRTHFQGRAISCIQNPAVGFEKELGSGTVKPATNKKKVMVIGGGPAGMEAARVAALRGHDVELYEKDEKLGGQVNIAVKIPTRDEVSDIRRYLEIQMEKLGVNVRLNKEVTPELVKSINPDVVVVATGSRPFILPIPGANKDHVVNVWDVLEDKVEVGNYVVIVDGGDSFWPCLGTAEFLLDRGKRVEVISYLYYIGMSIPAQSLPTLYQRLHKKGVILTPQTSVKEILPNTLAVENVFTNEERRIEGVDTVVMATGNRASDELVKALEGKVKELHAVGDCVAPRKVQDAIREGNRIGRLI